MANPTLSKKANETITPSENAKHLFQVIYNEQNKKDSDNDEVPKISVSVLISKMAFYYEKIRNSVDYKEEYLLRKNAIERILKRQIVIEGALNAKNLDAVDIASHLLTELIRAGYLPNNKIPETKIDEIAKIVAKYLLLRQTALSSVKEYSIKDKNELVNWRIAIMATEIEEQFGKSETDRVVIDIMYNVLLENIKLPDDTDFEDDKEIQIYVGIHRNLMKFDADMISYILFKYFNANWETASDEEIEKIGRNIVALREAIQGQLEHPLAVQLNRIISRYTVFFTMLKDVIEDDPVGCYESFTKDPKAFPRQIKKMAELRYKTAKTKLWRAAIRSIIYIFITKSVFAIIIEVPASRILGQSVNGFALAVNIIFPAALLFLIVLFTRLPSDDNSAKIVAGAREIVFEENKRKEPFRLRKPAVRRRSLNTVFGLIYAVTFFLSFGLVIWTLNRIGFNFVSIIIFLFFLAFVSFFSIRIRKNAREYIIVEPKENILSFIADFFYVPIVEAGKWLSEKFSRINVFVFVLDFIIEAPFKIFVTIAEEWTRYVKERKDEIV